MDVVLSSFRLLIPTLLLGFSLAALLSVTLPQETHLLWNYRKIVIGSKYHGTFFNGLDCKRVGNHTPFHK